MQRRKTIAPVAEPNMTPMMDIVFIMLIFFLVTASFVKETGLEINHPPHHPPSTEQDNTSIGFQISALNHFLYEGHPIDIWSAEAVIKQRHTEDPSLPVIINLVEGAHHGKMVRLYDAAIKGGVPRGQIAVITN